MYPVVAYDGPLAINPAMAVIEAAPTFLDGARRFEEGQGEHGGRPQPLPGPKIRPRPWKLEFVSTARNSSPSTRPTATAAARLRLKADPVLLRYTRYG